MRSFIFLVLLALLGTQYALRNTQHAIRAEARQTQLGEANICLPETAQASGDYRAFLPLVSSPANSRAFIETFDGAPGQPLSWRDTGWAARWDVAVHSRDVNTWYQLEPMNTDHGADCSPPPATHPLSRRYEDAVYQCRNHVMTAIKAEGYGMIYLTPNHMVDFSQGTATIRFDVSTLRTSLRDWIDLWITPYEDNLQIPLQTDIAMVDASGPPRRAVHVLMDLTGNFFHVTVYNNFQPTRYRGAYTPYDNLFTPDARRRDTFELQISRTRVKFGMPSYNLYWVDTTIPDLGWDHGVVQLGHHSYNPLKDCSTCKPGTWHWDNVMISPSRPFTIVHANRLYADREHPTVTLAAPAPANAHLRFTGIGPNLQVRFNDGAWQPAVLQAQDSRYFKDEHFRNYWMPIPAGTTQVEFRGDRWWGADWHARNITVWARP
jgi:hypothetical protein